MKNIFVFFVLMVFGLSAHAAGAKVITAKTVEASKGPLIIDLSKQAFKIDLKNLDTSKIVLTGRTKEITLAQWLKMAKKSGYSPKKNGHIMLTAKPSNFPGISDKTLKKVNALKDGEILRTQATSDTGAVQYLCLLLYYTCETW